MYKKAKHISIGDIVVLNDDENIKVSSIKYLEYSVIISGFINCSTEIDNRIFSYDCSIKILSLDSSNKTFYEKVSEFFKKCQFF